MDHAKKHTLFSALILHAVALICWVAYSFYQPIIFEDFGFQELTSTYLLIQNILLVIIPILSGFLTDKYLIHKGKAIISLMIGVMITACLFLSLVGVFLINSDKINPIIPVMMLIWVISMNMFYNPGISLLSQTARQSGWAFASAITGAVTDIIFAILSFLIIFFRNIGHIYTFVSGAILVILAAIYFYQSHKNGEITFDFKQKVKPLYLKALATSAIVGISLGFVHFKILHHLSFDLHGMNGSIIIPSIMVICALIIIRLHSSIHRQGLFKVFCLGIILCLAAYFFLNSIPTTAGLVLGLLILIPGIIAVSGSAFGAALEQIPSNWSNLGTGIFLAGFNSMIYTIN